MNRLARTLTVASTLSLVLLLSNCSSFDPSDIMDNMFASQKKPLPGERKPLFPEGTPGVTQGLPPELVKGYQAPPPPPDTTQDAQAVPDKPKPKPKPKPKVAATPPANQTPANQRSPPATAATAPARSTASSPWPDSTPARQTSAPAGAGQTMWPDPPPSGTIMR
jgi:hypothetical protein